MAESNAKHKREKAEGRYPRVSSANAIKFFIVDEDRKIPKRPSEELDNYKNSFGPLFTHQIFTLKETIFGYKNLNVDLFLSWSSLKILMKMHYSRWNFNRDDVAEILSNHFGEFFTTDESIFRKWLKNDIKQFSPPGEKIWSFSIAKSTDKTYEIYKNNLSNEDFVNEYNRILWCIVFKT